MRPSLVLDAYLVRSLAVAGWAASFDACARCGRRVRIGPSASPAVGRCASTAAAGIGDSAARDPGPAGGAAVGGLGVADASDERAAGRPSGLVSAYLQWHLERQLKSLPLVERI